MEAVWGRVVAELPTVVLFCFLEGMFIFRKQFTVSATRKLPHKQVQVHAGTCTCRIHVHVRYMYMQDTCTCTCRYICMCTTSCYTL